MWNQLCSSGHHLQFIYAELGLDDVAGWASLVQVYNAIGDFMFFRSYVPISRSSVPTPSSQTMNRDQASSIVDTFERLEIASFTPKDIQCLICYSNFDDTVPGTDGALVDDSPVETPCCGQILDRDCFIETLLNDCRCLMCRRCCVPEHGNTSAGSD
jgi:hypothetical protein